jgi:heme A synthase
MSSNKPASNKAFSRVAWAFLAYLIGVILFGAWVRITHSGAGCGSHWPTCHGQIIPIEPSVETMIEFTHRLTSGLCGIMGLVIVGWAIKLFGAGSRITRAAIVTLIFIIIEGAIGAGLVLRELVESNDSVERAIIISLHLVNTLALTASATMAAWWAGAPEGQARALPDAPWRIPQVRYLMLGLLGIILTSMTGAVTALGDTLFPPQLIEGQGLLTRVSQDIDPTNHFLIRLRIVHPIVASIAALVLISLSSSILSDPTRSRAIQQLATSLAAITVAQVLCGLLNVALQAPGWMQLVHLLIANLVWISVLLLTMQTAVEHPSLPERRA